MDFSFFKEHFGLIRGAGFATCFVFAAALQWIFPYRVRSGEILRNWTRNLPLAGFNSFALGAVCASCVCSWSVFLKSSGYGLLNLLRAPEWFSILLALFVFDATAYFWHRANHFWPVLWRFHRVHHTDRIFEVSTAVRFHLGELLAALAIRFTVVGAFGFSVAAILIFELVFQFFNLIGHGNIRIAEELEKWLEKVFITPALHRKHHSIIQSELNSNFGTIFSFWDRLFQTALRSRSSETVDVGVQGMNGNASVRELLVMPLQRLERPGRN